MKKIFFIAILAISPFFLFCQSDSPVVLDSTHLISWDSDINDWKVFARDVYNYDAKGNIINQVTYYLPSEAGEWETYRNHIYGYVYDAKGNMLKKQYRRWESWEADTLLKEISLTIYSYDSNGNLSKEVFFEADIHRGWVNNGSRIEYAYDDNGNLTEKKKYYENSPRDRYVYAYDANENLTVKLRFEWDNETSEWAKRKREVFVYDSYGKLTEVFYYGVWYLGNGEHDKYLHLDYRDVYTYNADGNLTEKTPYSLNSETNTWEYCGSGFGAWYFRYEYKYDTKGNIVEEIHSGYQNNGWTTQEHYRYYWSELATTIGKSSIDQLCTIYPNPTNSLITIETEQPDQYSIEITSLNGQQLFSTEMEGTTHQIDLSSFSNGVYLITIRSKDFVTTRKIIKL